MALKLTGAQRQALMEDMQKRIELLHVLAPFNLKRMSSRYGVPYHVLWSLQRTMQVQNIHKNVLQTAGE